MKREKKGKSLKVFLSTIVAVLLMMLLGGSQILFYKASYKSIEKAYLNQMHNFDRQVSMELVNYYDQQVKNARFLAEHGTIIEAAKTGAAL